MNHEWGRIGFVLKSSFGIVAEREGRILGSNFLNEGGRVAALGPISVDPDQEPRGSYFPSVGY